MIASDRNQAFFRCAAARWLLSMSLAAGLMMAAWRVRSADVDLTPTEFKAAFLSKILPYVDWPEEAFGAGNTIVIGVLGQDPVAELLTALMKGKRVGRHEVIIKQVEDPSAIRGQCHVLFVPAPQTAKWREWIGAETFPGLLTVGESERFNATSEFVFNLSVRERQLEISLRNARTAGVEVSSKLLKFAKVYR